jgi:hypothetical protein
MRGLIFLVAVIILLALVGWISFSSDPNRSSINLETQEIKQDTQRAVETGKELLDDAKKSVQTNDAAPLKSTPIQPQIPAVQE